jgi:hypothetical protein
MATGFDLREKLKRKVKAVIDKLSGEHSDAAPEQQQGYSRPGQPNEEAEVVMARLNRPGAANPK